MTSKTPASSKRAVLPRVADYTKAFAAEFVGNGYLEQVTVSSESPYLYADGSGLYSKDKSTL